MNRPSWLRNPLQDADPRVIRKMAVGVLLGVILFLLPAPEGLSTEGKDALALFLLLVYFWATEALPLPVTALCAGVGLVLLDIVETSNQAWTPYAQDTIFLLLGSLIIADAVTKTGMDRVLASRLLRRLGRSTDSLLFGIVVVTTLSAMVIASHAIAAVMLPLVLSILRSTGLIARRNIAAAYVLAIAFATGIAGLATPSAGGRNAIVLGYLDELYGVHISYLEWTLHAAPITLVLIPVTYLLLKLIFRVPHERLEPGSVDVTTARLDRAQWLTILIVVATVALWIAKGDAWGLGTVAIMGAVSLFIFGVLDWVDTRKRVAWGVPLIYGAALTMGAALQATGAAEWMAQTILYFGEDPSTLVLTTVVLVFTGVLTQIMSDGGTAAVVAPVTLSVAAITGYSLESMGMLTAIAAAFSFLLVVGTPPNVITYSSGLFSAKDLAKSGAPLALVAMGITWLAVTFYWPLLQ